jgi:hypothetical protein
VAFGFCCYGQLLQDRSAYCCSLDKIWPHITEGRLCISALWLLEKLFNYWELLRRGVTATRKRFLRMIGCSELVLSLARLMMLCVWSLMFHAFTAALVSTLILQDVLKCDCRRGEGNLLPNR